MNSWTLGLVIAVIILVSSCAQRPEVDVLMTLSNCLKSPSRTTYSYTCTEFLGLIKIKITHEIRNYNCDESCKFKKYSSGKIDNYGGKGGVYGAWYYDYTDTCVCHKESKEEEKPLVLLKGAK